MVNRRKQNTLESKIDAILTVGYPTCLTKINDDDGAWRHGWSMKLCYKLKMHRGIDGTFAFSSGLCSWINKDSRTCSRRQLLSLPMTWRLWKSTRWSGLTCKCLHTEELSDVWCSSIRFIKLRLPDVGGTAWARKLVHNVKPV